MDTAAEEMQDGNRRDLGRRIWLNGLEEQQRTGEISAGNDYQPEGVLLLRLLRRGVDEGPAQRFGIHLEIVCLIL